MELLIRIRKGFVTKGAYAADEAADDRDERALAAEDAMLDAAEETELDKLAEALAAREALDAATEALDAATEASELATEAAAD